MEIEEVTLFKNTITGIHYPTRDEAEKDLMCRCCSVNYPRKHYTTCQECADKTYKESELKKDKKFLEQEGIDWSLVDVPVYDKTTDKWFDESFEMLEHYEEESIDLEDARLVMGELEHLSVDLYGLVEEALAEWDKEISDLDPEFVRILSEAQNMSEKIHLGHLPSNKRVIYVP